MFTVSRLGECKIKSPMQLSTKKNDGICDFVGDDERILYSNSFNEIMENFEKKEVPISFEKIGAKEFLYFEPAKTKVAIVTCGGLCPGLNNVIRGLVVHLWNAYKVTKILGVQYGYAGLDPRNELPFIELDPDLVDNIHKEGGSILGSSRGEVPAEVIVDTLEQHNINILFCVGGDGTLRGAHAIAQEIDKRKLKISIAGVPKTVDNDINYITKSFGFESAFTAAQSIILNAHHEAKGAQNGVALIKLMGRDSGFIAAYAAMAVPDVNIVLVPEMDFDLENKKQTGLFNYLEKRLRAKQHAVIVVAEGAGQNLFHHVNKEIDASGNVLHADIGIFLRDKIKEYFEKKEIPIAIKYIDPSYIIRSVPANANDSKFCVQLTTNAVHAAMAGRTDFLVGYWNNAFTLLPIQAAAIGERKKINTESDFWLNVLEATRQPSSFK
ncbi:MAG: ATP-dependent 6-phosphofructokinase [Bacteroidales bacterium]|jgi:6-phosphofructokinase 1|nr:ATP-dependent 6-phosphofructokinase [Bacteroidales bacterium]